jgi:hypothetical protein
MEKRDFEKILRNHGQGSHNPRGTQPEVRQMHPPAKADSAKLVAAQQKLVAHLESMASENTPRESYDEARTLMHEYLSARGVSYSEVLTFHPQSFILPTAGEEISELAAGYAQKKDAIVEIHATRLSQSINYTVSQRKISISVGALIFQNLIELTSNIDQAIAEAEAWRPTSKSY